MTYDLIIVGAGASGLSAAFKAIHSNSNLKILVIEKEKIPGRKLSAAGNGKCNITNNYFNEDCYLSSSIQLKKDLISKHSQDEILDFFKEVGILLYEKNGYYYPLSNQGKQVTNLLFLKSKQLGVNFQLESTVINIRKDNSNKHDCFKVDVLNKDNNTISYTTTHIVLANGGFAASKLGGTKSGYHLCQQMNLNLVPIHPALTPAYIKDCNLKLAKGVRIDALVRLKTAEEDNLKEYGQVQFNETSLSGIVIMNFSSFFNHWDSKNCVDCIQLDLLPNLSWDALKSFFIKQQSFYPDETLLMMLGGLLPTSLIKYICKRIKIDENMLLYQLNDKYINRITSNLKKLTFTPIISSDYEKAQVTAGGVSLNEIDLNTFESKKNKNLYIIGELLDINGKCGGYNISFAILSAIQAINAILRKEKHD